MLNCLLIKKMESYFEMDLYCITVIFHLHDFEQYVCFLFVLRIMLRLNFPVGHFPHLKLLQEPRVHIFFKFLSFFFLTDYGFHFMSDSSLKQSSLTWLTLAPSSLILQDNILELPSVLLQTSGTFFILSPHSFLVI